MKKEVHSLKEFHELVLEIKKQISFPCLVLLSGPMGAGKTEFVKSFCHALGIKSVASPTFAIHHRYKGDQSVDHFDLCRLENEDQLESTGFWDLLSYPEGYIFIEWFERLDLKLLPRQIPTYQINIALNDQKRIVEFKKINS